MSNRVEIKTQMYETSNLLDDLNDTLDTIDDNISSIEASLISHRRPNVRDAFNHLFQDSRYDRFIRTKRNYKTSSKYRKAQTLVETWKKENEATRKNDPNLVKLLERRREISTTISRANKLFYKLERELGHIEDNEIAFIPEEHQEPDEPAPLEELQITIKDITCTPGLSSCKLCNKRVAILKSSSCNHHVSCYDCSDKLSECPKCGLVIEEFTFTV